MNRLKPLLKVRELPPALMKQRQYLPSIRDLIRSEAGPHERDVLAYLAHGLRCGVYGDPGLGRDVLLPTQLIPTSYPPDVPSLAPQLTYTDGTWGWWGATYYYLLRYHLRVPHEFIAHALSNNWRIDSSRIALSTLDDSALDEIESKPGTQEGVQRSS